MMTFCGVITASVRAEVPEIVVSPYLVATPIARAGSTVSVISRSRIERSSAGSVADLLRTVPGLAVIERGGAGGQTQVSLRGAEAQHTLVLIDGIRVNDPSSARDTFDFAVLSLTDIERIEILKGPQSALYGSDAVGGVINIITRRPRRGIQSSATVEGGSYGTRAAKASMSGGDDHFRMLFSGSYFASAGFSRVGDRDSGERDGTEKFAGTIRGVVNGRDGTSLDFGLDGHHQASDIDRSATVDAAGYTSQRDLVTGFGRLRFNAHDGRLNNTVTVFAAYSARAFGEPTRTTYYRGGDVGAEYQAHLKFDALSSLLFGLRGEQEAAYRKRTDKPEPYYDATRSLFAGYLLYQLPLDRLNLSFAVRHDGQIGEQGFTTGRVTAVHDFPDVEARVRASLGTGAKRPTVFQLSFNAALRPETSIGADLGIEKVLHDGRTTVSATGFWNRFSDMIDFDGDFFTGTYKNIAQAETAGVELALRKRIVPGKLSATLAYTFLHSRDLTTGLPLQRRARHSGKLAVTYTGIKNLEATLSVTAVGKRFNDDLATVGLAPYARIDVSASYRVSSEVSLFARIENLLNADYQDVKGYNTAGFSAYAGLNWRT